MVNLLILLNTTKQINSCADLKDAPHVASHVVSIQLFRLSVICNWALSGLMESRFIVTLFESELLHLSTTLIAEITEVAKINPSG